MRRRLLVLVQVLRVQSSGCFSKTQKASLVAASTQFTVLKQQAATSPLPARARRQLLKSSTALSVSALRIFFGDNRALTRTPRLDLRPQKFRLRCAELGIWTSQLFSDVSQAIWLPLQRYEHYILLKEASFAPGTVCAPLFTSLYFLLLRYPSWRFGWWVFIEKTT